MMTTMESMTTIDLAGVDASAASAPETSIDQIHIETTEERFLIIFTFFLAFSISFRNLLLFSEALITPQRVHANHILCVM